MNKLTLLILGILLISCGKPSENTPIDASKNTDSSINKYESQDSFGLANSSNFQVKIGKKWKGICCEGERPNLSRNSCEWESKGRKLKDITMRINS